jgi:hypothetical protein
MSLMGFNSQFLPLFVEAYQIHRVNPSDTPPVALTHLLVVAIP